MEDDNTEENNDSLSTSGDDNNDGSGDKGDGPGGNPPNAGDSKDNREDDDKNMGGSDSGGHEDYQDSSTHGDNHSDDRDNGNQDPNSQTSDSRTLSNSTSSFSPRSLGISKRDDTEDDFSCLQGPPCKSQKNEFALPKHDLSLREMYKFVMCSGVYDIVDTKWKSITHQKIHLDRYKQAMESAFYFFCEYASWGEEMFYSSCDDPDKMREFLEYNDECDPYAP